MTDFDSAFQYLEVDEKGYWDDPSGGPTNFGITMAMFATWRKTSVTTDDVKNMKIDEAFQIFKTMWWDRLQLGLLPQGTATAILDILVNMGESAGSKLVQIALGQPSPDGIIGSQTREQLIAEDPSKFIKIFVGVIQDHYCDIVVHNPERLDDLKGWIRRALRLINLI
jgi:lysozyme family protein